MVPPKHKRPLELSTSSGDGEEYGGQRQSKRPAPVTSSLQNHEINGSSGHFTLDDIGQVVMEGWKQVKPDLIELIDSRIQNALKGFIPQINSSLKNVILVCKGMDHPDPHSYRTPPNSNQITDTTNMQLRFNTKFSCPVYNTIPLQEQLECPILIKLIDASTGRVVTSGPESCAKVDVVVLKGDFKKEDQDTWSVQEFEECMVKERRDKRPLLIGELQVTLKAGIGELGDLTFTDNSSWTPSKTFRIGVKFESGFCEGSRVREAITEEFPVMEYRGKAYEKHIRPASEDEIWRLKNIGKDGRYCKRLNDKGIRKVEEFVRHLVGDSKKLRNILGKGIPDKKWKVLIDHANKCVPNGKSYVYYVVNTKDYGVVINNICELKGLTAGGEYHTTDQLSDSEKAHADDLVKAASMNWNHVEDFSAEAFANFSNPVLNNRLSACPGVLPINQQPCPSDCYLTPPSFPTIGSSKAPLGSTVDSTVGFGNVNQDRSAGITPPFLIPSHGTNPTCIISEQVANPWNQLETSGNENVQCPAPHESLPFFCPTSSPFKGECSYKGLWSPSDDLGRYFMAENEDIQNLFNDIGTESSSNPQIGRKSTKGNGRGVVGWLKVKAILSWGYFVKERERIVELDY